MNVKQLATLKNAYDRRKELLEFEKHLKENPLQESEFRGLINESNLDLKDKTSYLHHGLRTLRENEMVIDDIPETFEDFSVRAEKQGKVPIKSSVMKQMNKDEFTKLTTKSMALYDDLNGRQHIQHFEYRGRNGIMVKTGDGISVNHTQTDDVETIKNAQRHYKEAKDIISKTLSEIEVNGDTYQNFMKPKD